jgi:hypothetical protein
MEKKSHPTPLTLIKFKEEDSTVPDTSIDNLEERKIDSIASEKIITESQAMYRISPVLIVDKSNGFVYPKIKVENLDEALEYSKGIDSSTDYNSVKQKFNLKEAMNLAFSSQGGMSQIDLESESNFLDVVDPNFDINNSEFTIIKKPENEEDPRKHLDKFNLIKGFTYAYDPLNTKSKMNYDEDYDNCQIEFFSAETQIKDLLDINI